MDTNEQALVEVSAAALAAPSAAVAGLVAASIAANTKRTYAAALKRLDAALEGQDLTDASLALYLARLHAAGLSPAGCLSARRKPIRKAGAPAVGQRHPPNHPPPGRPLSASRAGYPVTVSALVARNRWPPAGPRLSRCRRRAGGSHRRCRATMHGGQLAARGAVARVRYGRG